MPELFSRPSPRLALAGVAVVLLTVIGGGAWWMRRGLPDDVAVRVGSTDVTVGELRDRMATVEALYGVAVPDDDSDADAFWRDAAHSVAVGLVLDRAADEADVSISGQEVDASLQQVISSFFGTGTAGEAAFTQALGTAGTSEKAVRDELRRQLEVNALFASVTSDVASPSAADVASAYDERRCTLRLPEKRRLRNIVVASEDDARDALRRLRRGESFASVVAALSIDASTRDTAGDLGLVARSDLEAGYAKAAFGAATAQLYGPVRGEFGWNVGRVEAVRAGRVPTLEEARDGLRQKLFSEGQSTVWRRWLGKELKDADVRYAADYTPKDPLALPSDGPGATPPGGTSSGGSAPAAGC
ncbi:MULTISPECIES: peptidyl-prolyl cis-trans isomerase [unclassified Nocardioides]|uniref:peptidylprolyl isomerase n=1 Tax=unclassified Nocardioides TaxID=2615069 RepID=UPI000703BD63|nr:MULTISPECIES: peptidyl-prolyl cis-trans isomerase [unclassified Nocardioides]KRC54165.1 hypothetical protein ASE19_08930 [Nocardioides sp. Root79]KRC71501.1 hypothetical protein ASE20_11345 [Nocardioides sp. Root240]